MKPWLQNPDQVIKKDKKEEGRDRDRDRDREGRL
jgi:hypothetical protein